MLIYPLLKSFLGKLDLAAEPEMWHAPTLVTVPKSGGRLAQELRSLLHVENNHGFILSQLNVITVFSAIPASIDRLPNFLTTSLNKSSHLSPA
jgi:hypothetical protein